MKNLKNIYKIVNILLIVTCVISLSGCSVFAPRPPKAKAVEKELSQYIYGMSPCIDERFIDSLFKYKYDDKVYLFTDKNGMEFIWWTMAVGKSFVDTRIGHDYEGIYESFWNSNYFGRIFPFYEDRLSEICNKYGMEYVKEDKIYKSVNPSGIGVDPYGNEYYWDVYVLVNKDDDPQAVKNMVYDVLSEIQIAADMDKIYDERGYYRTEALLEIVYVPEDENGKRIFEKFRLIEEGKEPSYDEISSKIDEVFAKE